MRINHKLRLGYDIGKGYITGEEEVQNFIGQMVDNSKISKKLNNLITTGRLEVMKELGTWGHLAGVLENTSV